MPETERKKLWWNNPDREEGARGLYSLSLASDKINSTRRTRARRDGSCYEGIALSAYGASGYDTDAPFRFPGAKDENAKEEDGSQDTPIIINVFKAIVATLTSKIAALNKPKTAVMTSYGKWKDRRNGVKIARLIEADFKRPPTWQYPTVWAMCEHGFKLAHAATGDVAVKVTEYPNSSEVCYELHDTLDFFFDYDELTYGSPLTMGVTTWWDPEEAAATWPHAEVEILSAQEEPPEGITPAGSSDAKRAKMVRIVEGWRLTSADGTPGVYMICLKDGFDLTDPEDVEYDYRTFPVAFYNCDKQLSGPWSTSTTALIYELIKIANECTLSMANAEKNMPKAALLLDPEGVEDDDTKILKDFSVFRRKGGKTVASLGNPVQAFNPAMFDRLNIEFVNWLIELAHNVSGMPQSQTASKREEGLPSAQAQRQIAAIASERFAQSVGNYIQWVAVDIPKLAVRAMKRIHDRDGSFMRMWTKESKNNTSAKFMREISSDVLDDFDDNRYVLSAEAVGGVKNTPADRVQTALEGVQMGAISPDRYQGMIASLDTPGLTPSGQQEWWDNECDRWMFADPEEVNEPGFYKGPLPAMNLDEASLQVLEAFFQADLELSQDPSEDYRLEFFTQALTEIDYLAKQKAQFTASLGQPQPQPAQPVAA